MLRVLAAQANATPRREVQPALALAIEHCLVREEGDYEALRARQFAAAGHGRARGRR
jgi:hypothetical protein